jgi:hypothetical protein
MTRIDRRQISADIRTDIRELRSRGVAFRSIQAITGVSVPTIRRYTRDIPVPPAECPWCGATVDRGPMNTREFCTNSHRIMYARKHRAT